MDRSNNLQSGNELLNIHPKNAHGFGRRYSYSEPFSGTSQKDETVYNIGTRMRILEMHSKITEPMPLSLTVSAGGAVVRPGDTMESFLQRADEKLYQARKAGKNCVCI